MSRTAYEKIASGLAEAIAITRGKAEPARLHVADMRDAPPLHTREVPPPPVKKPPR